MADRMIQKPLACRIAHCGASCNRMTVDMCVLYKDITKCPFYERRDDMYEKDYTNVVLDKIRAEIANLDDADYDYEGYYKAVTDALQIIDKYRGGE